MRPDPAEAARAKENALARDEALPSGLIGALISRADSWFNAVTGLGGVRDKVALTTAASCVIKLSDPQLETMYATDGLAARGVDIYPREAMREGFELGGLGDNEEEVTDFLRELDVVAKVTDAAIWGRLFGGAVIWLGSFGANNITPFKEGDRVDFLRVLDRRCVTPSSYTAEWIDEQGRPLVYDINKPEGTSGKEDRPGQGAFVGRVHRSRFIFFGGAKTDERARVRMQGWDYSVLQRAYDALRADGLLWASAGQLVSEASIGVTKIKGLWSMVAGSQKERLTERIQLANMARSISRSMILDADGEDYTRVNTTFAGVADLTDRSIKRLAADFECPVTVLMGEAPAGLSATGESDLRWFFSRVQAYREQQLQPQLLVLLRALLSQPDAPKVKVKEIAVKWPNLWKPSAKEQAEVYSATATADIAYITAGVLDSVEVALSRFGEDGYSQETEIDRELREEMMQPDPAAEEAPELEGEEPAEDSEGSGGASELESGPGAKATEVAEAKAGEQAAATAPTEGGAKGRLAAVGAAKAGAGSSGKGGAIAGGPSGDSIQQQALNGAQVTGAIDVIVKVANKEISRESGVAVLMLAFQVKEEDAQKLLGPLDFVATPPEPEFGFGGGGGFGGGDKSSKGDKGADAPEKGAPPPFKG